MKDIPERAWLSSDGEWGREEQAAIVDGRYWEGVEYVRADIHERALENERLRERIAAMTIKTVSGESLGPEDHIRMLSEGVAREMRVSQRLKAELNEIREELGRIKEFKAELARLDEVLQEMHKNAIACEQTLSAHSGGPRRSWPR